MSIVRCAWALITGFYLATLVVCLALVVPQVKGHLEHELASRSATAVGLAASAYASLAADDPRPLRSYATLLRDRAALGGWERFELMDAMGVVVVPAETSRPSWAEQLAGGWAASVATAPLMQGTQSVGTVRVWVNSSSATQVVERCLWAVFGAFGGIGALMVLALARMVRWAQAPLRDFNQLVQGVSESRYVALKEPRVTEWIELSRSLNVMVARVRHLLEAGEAAVDDLQDRLAIDELTHAASRPHFMQTLSARLKDNPEGGCAVIVRVHDLDGMNRRAGRSRADEFLVAVATTLRARLMLAGKSDEMVLARLNGADFGLLLAMSDAAAVRLQLNLVAQSLASLAGEGLSEGPQVAWIGASMFRQGEALPAVLMRVDAMVMNAESKLQPMCLADPLAAPHVIAVAQWRVLIETALDTGRFSLAFIDVRDLAGALIHREARVRLVGNDGRWLEASDIVPPAIRNGRISDVDLRVVELGLLELTQCDGAVAVNLAAQSLRRPAFQTRLARLLQEHAAVAGRLCIEVDERGFDNAGLYAVEALCLTVAPFGCRLGIDQFGTSLSMLPFLSAARPHYVKLAPYLLTALAQNERQRAFIAQLAELGRRVGVPVIACGAIHAADRALLEELGVSGFTGPALLAREGTESEHV